MFLKFEDLTLEQKIGMVLCARRCRDEDIDFILKLVKKHALGSLQAPFWKPEVAKLVKETADYPILIVNDTERGYPTSKLPKIPLVSLAATGKKEYFQAFAKAVVRDAQADNCNGTWGPVIDILHQDGPISVPRKRESSFAPLFLLSPKSRLLGDPEFCLAVSRIASARQRAHRLRHAQSVKCLAFSQAVRGSSPAKNIKKRGMPYGIPRFLVIHRGLEPRTP